MQLFRPLFLFFVFGGWISCFLVCLWVCLCVYVGDVGWTFCPSVCLPWQRRKQPQRCFLFRRTTPTIDECAYAFSQWSWFSRHLKFRLFIFLISWKNLKMMIISPFPRSWVFLSLARRFGAAAIDPSWHLREYIRKKRNVNGKNYRLVYQKKAWKTN